MRTVWLEARGGIRVGPGIELELVKGAGRESRCKAGEIAVSFSVECTNGRARRRFGFGRNDGYFAGRRRPDPEVNSFRAEFRTYRQTPGHLMHSSESRGSRCRSSKRAE